MKYIKETTYFLSLCIFLITACSSSSDDSDGPTDPVDELVPTDLVLTIDIEGKDDSNPNGNGSGHINITASAANAVKYEFQIDGGAEQISTTGTLEHTFTTTGTNNYLITVVAYSETNRTATTFKTVTVLVASDGPQLIFSDEFDVDGAPDSSKWNYDIGSGGWGNGELQYYTDRLENAVVEDGLLKIKAKKENFEGADYTSARLKTENKFEFTYGRIEVRAKLPAVQGTWPAIWMLGANFSEVSWPRCGEIDIMEQTGNDKNTVLGTCHWLNTSDNTTASYGLNTTVSTSTSEFHVYSADWTEDYIRIAVDGNQFYEIALNDDLPFDKDFFNILNVAVGGTLGGSVDPNFTESTMEIDYIRIYQ